MGNFTTVPDVIVGQNFPPSLWESAIMNNLNLGVARQLGDTSLGGPAATVAFGSIPVTFAHLLLIWEARTDVAATTDTLVAQYNGNSGTYAYQQLHAASTTLTGSQSSGQTNFTLGTIAGASATATQFGVGFQLIPNYALTGGVVQKHGIGMGGVWAAAGFLDLIVGQLASTGAITSITLKPGAGSNLVANSRFSLYGLPA